MPAQEQGAVKCCLYTISLLIVGGALMYVGFLLGNNKQLATPAATVAKPADVGSVLAPCSPSQLAVDVASLRTRVVTQRENEPWANAGSRPLTLLSNVVLRSSECCRPK